MRKCYDNNKQDNGCNYKHGEVCLASRGIRYGCIYKNREEYEYDRAQKRYKLKCQCFKEEVKQFFENYQPKHRQQ